jgi:predicted RNA-binding Zn-ribbon protein involved in translation (DUF1610 family)
MEEAMPETMTCPNAACGATIGVAGREIGDTVTCPKCGQKAKVLAEVGKELDIELLTPDDVADGHPARLKCTVCGAVLGVRDATCPKCGGDIRSGVTHIRITEEDKRRHGLFFRRSKATGGRRRSGARALVGLALILVLAVAGLAAALTLPKRDPAFVQPPPEGRVTRRARGARAGDTPEDTPVHRSRPEATASSRRHAVSEPEAPDTGT